MLSGTASSSSIDGKDVRRVSWYGRLPTVVGIGISTNTIVHTVIGRRLGECAEEETPCCSVGGLLLGAGQYAILGAGQYAMVPHRVDSCLPIQPPATAFTVFTEVKFGNRKTYSVLNVIQKPILALNLKIFRLALRNDGSIWSVVAVLAQSETSTTENRMITDTLGPYPILDGRHSVRRHQAASPGKRGR